LSSKLDQRLAFLGEAPQQALLTRLCRGIEKESLRMDGEGILAQTPHPAAFGSSMSHPSITTDFSEALLEFITPVSTSIGATLGELEAIHRFAYAELQGESLWNASMPCRLSEQDDEIPVAQYGSSHPATMKTRYRLGLGHRYGRKMQTIAGIHYNFSLPPALWQALHDFEGNGHSQQDYVTERYFSLIRNFRRWCWLLVYLFGAAPAVSRCFLNGRPHSLEDFDSHTLYLPYATSLRMGDLGYQSDAQKNLNICYNRLDNYIETLRGAITTSHPDYERFPADEQLSTGLLQIENEFYSPIRPKRVTASGEIPLGALRRGGVEYIEVRCLDVNPLLPMGIDAQQIRFLDSFLLYCLIEDSPECDDADNLAVIDNLLDVVNRGREPGLTLRHNGDSLTLSQWADRLLDGISAVAEQLDAAHGGHDYRAACNAQRDKVRDPALTPSAQILSAMKRDQQSFFAFAMDQSQQHAEQLRQRPLDAAENQRFASMREQSLVELREAEAQSTGTFDDYLARFYKQYDDL